MLLDRVTLAPPVGAAWFSVTVQVLDEFGPRVLGLQPNEETSTGATSVTVVAFELLLYVAVTVALPLLLMVPVVTLKVCDVSPASTVTDAGTVSVELEFDKLTLAPPVGAAWFNVTVQVLDEFGPRLPGLHVKPESVTGAWRVTVVAFELLL